MSAQVPISMNDTDRLDSAIALAQTLEATLEQEFVLLKDQHLDAFEALQSGKHELLRKLVELSGVNETHSADALGTEWEPFKLHIAHCRGLHRRNETLISRKLESIRGALQSLQIQDPASSVEIYDRLGKMSRMKRPRGSAIA
jgi:flagellar biosynthesis/type III secretory pathway chaperone